MAESSSNETEFSGTDSCIQTRIKSHPNTLWAFKWSIENFLFEEDYLLRQDFEHASGVKCYCQLSMRPTGMSITVVSQTRLYCELVLSDCHGKLLYKNSVQSCFKIAMRTRRTMDEPMNGICHLFKAEGDDSLKELANLPNHELVLFCRIAFQEPQTEVRHFRVQKNLECPAEFLQKLSDDLKDVTSTLLEEKVEICVGGDSLAVNKAVICARSSFFAKMFETDMRERHEQKAVLMDIDMSILKMIIQFLYSGIVPECGFEALCDLYRAADRFQIPQLRSSCVNLISRNFTVQNIWPILFMADQRNDLCLKNSVLMYFSAYFEELVATNDWHSLMFEQPNLAFEIIRFFRSRKKI